MCELGARRICNCATRNGNRVSSARVGSWSNWEYCASSLWIGLGIICRIKVGALANVDWVGFGKE